MGSTNVSTFAEMDDLQQVKKKIKADINKMVHDFGSPMMFLSVVATKADRLSPSEQDTLTSSIARIREIYTSIKEFYLPQDADDIEFKPESFTNVIVLKPDDTIIVLDDEKDVHKAWQIYFEATLKRYPDLKIKCFEYASDLFKFIEKLSEEDKAKLFLLSDYKLLNQDTNGLEVIQEVNLRRTVLVTSNFSDPDLLNGAASAGAKILPKKIAFKISITVLD